MSTFIDRLLIKLLIYLFYRAYLHFSHTSFILNTSSCMNDWGLWEVKNKSWFYQICDHFYIVTAQDESPRSQTTTYGEVYPSTWLSLSIVYRTNRVKSVVYDLRIQRLYTVSSFASNTLIYDCLYCNTEPCHTVKNTIVKRSYAAITNNYVWIPEISS